MKTEDEMKFSKNLNKYLESKNLSIKELADSLKVPSSTVHGWLNGVPPRSIFTLKKIALHLNCTIDELCFDEKRIDGFKDPDLVISLGQFSYRIVLKRIEKKEEA
jgi:transcriptional regulator with XRE-family HTH domain